MAVVAEEGWKSSGLLKGSGIPAPSGQYRVGCVDLMHQLAGDEKGGLLVRLTYPTEATPGAGYSYSAWQPHRAYTKGYLTLERPPSAMDGFLSLLFNALVSPKIPALEGAPLFGSGCKDEESGTAAAPVFPVIVFSHGLCGMRTMYSAIVCDLASHGYVVAAVEHRDESAAACLQRVPKPGGREGELQDQWIRYLYRDVPKFKVDPVANAEAEFPFRNKQVKQRADEVGKSLDILTLLNQGAEIRNMMAGSYDFKKFKGRLDISTAAVLGHSFGGGTTVQTLSQDNRFKCGIALDCWMIPIASEIYNTNTSISQPLYFINSYTHQWRENMKRMLPMARPVDDRGLSPCRIVTIKGTHHLNQCDSPYTTSSTVASFFKMKRSELPDVVAHQLNMEICHGFLKRHLLKDPEYQGVVPNLDGTEGHSEHILFGTNVKMSVDRPAGSPVDGGVQEGVEDEGTGTIAEGEVQEGGKGEGQEGVAKEEGTAEGGDDATAKEGEGQEGVATAKGGRQDGIGDDSTGEGAEPAEGEVKEQADEAGGNEEATTM